MRLDIFLLLSPFAFAFVLSNDQIFTYTIGWSNVVDFHHCRCVSNAILTTCTHIIHNGRLKKKNKTGVEDKDGIRYTLSRA